MEKVIAFLKTLHPVSGPMETELRSVLHFKEVNKNSFLIREGDLCSHAWYLQKGLVRCFYTRDEYEVTTWFAEEDKIILLFKALFGQKKSLFNLQALEDCELYAIHYHDLQMLYGKFPETRMLHHIIAEHYSHLKDLKIRATSGLAPKERYLYFQKHFPHLQGRIKPEHLDSYLDMDISKHLPSLFRSESRRPEIAGQIKEYLHNNLSADLSAVVVAEKFRLSVSSVHRIFKEQEHKTYKQYVSEVRMEAAFNILYEGGRVKEAMYATGYKYRGTFNAAFKRRYGRPPTHFQNK